MFSYRVIRRKLAVDPRSGEILCRHLVAMNQSARQDSVAGALSKNLLAFSLFLAISCINGVFVYTFFRSPQLQQEAR